MKKHLLLFCATALLCSLAACSTERPEATTKFENMSSVFATVKVLDTFGTVAGYEENDEEVYVLVYSEQLEETLRMLVTERTRFAGETGEKYENREIGWNAAVISEHNPQYLTDFYPLSYVWLLPEDSTVMNQEPTTRFEDKNSVFYACNVRNFPATVIKYEEIDGEVYIILLDQKTEETVRVLVTEKTTFFSDELKARYDKREAGWEMFAGCGYNQLYLTDFYPLSYVWLLPEDSIDETQVELPQDSIFRFLSESNNGSLLTDPNEPPAPGELDDPAAVPQPEQDPVGTTASLSLSLPKSETSDQVAFHYLRNDETNREVTVAVVGNVKFPLLMVLKTEFGSADAMLECVRQGSTFEAQIAAMVNVTYIEGCIYMRDAVLPGTGLADQETVNLEQAQELNGAQYIGFYSSDQPLQVKGLYGSEISAALTENLHVFWKVYERFGLTELLHELLGSDFAI